MLPFRWIESSRSRLAALSVIAVAAGALPLAAASPALALGQRCGVVRHPLNDTYSYDASVLALRVPCQEARGLAAEWYLRLEAQELPAKVFAGEYATTGTRPGCSDSIADGGASGRTSARSAATDRAGAS